jgi:ceramide glucosyltransferase
MRLDPVSLLGWLSLALSGVGCLYLLFAAHAVRRFAARPRVAAAGLAPVTVLKPLYGEDAGLADNLRSFCRQAYPEWQIVCGVQSQSDPAIAIVRAIMAEFPHLAIDLVIEERLRGSNRKVANLQNMLPAARHDVLVIADSDMRVEPDYLAQVTAPLADPANGLVTCLYRGVATEGLWSRLAALHINHGFLPQAVVADAIGVTAGCFGATMALRRQTLDAVGGLAGIQDALADDHALGAAVRHAGRRVVLSSCIVDDIVAEPSFAALLRHELRWARTIRLLSPAGFAGSIVTQPLVFAVAALPTGLPSGVGPAMLLLALVARFGMVRLVDRALGVTKTPLWLVVLRDLLSFAVFAASFWSRRVAWRDRMFRVGPKGQLIIDGDRSA